MSEYIPDRKPGSDEPQQAGDNFSESMRCIADDGRINISHVGQANVPSVQITKNSKGIISPPKPKEGK
jgi:hypothetical protein